MVSFLDFICRKEIIDPLPVFPLTKVSIFRKINVLQNSFENRFDDKLNWSLRDSDDPTVMSFL